jgi:MFS family permease
MSVKAVSVSLPGAGRIGDVALMHGIWLLMLAQILSTFPALTTGIFLPAMAADAGSDPALVGGLRGLGGAAAMICGVLVAPLIDRVARAWAISGGLALPALGALVATFGSVATLMLFFTLAGAAGAVTDPAVQSAAADGRDRRRVLRVGRGSLAMSLQPVSGSSPQAIPCVAAGLRRGAILPRTFSL